VIRRPAWHCVANGKTLGNNPLFGVAYADLDTGLAFTAGDNPNRFAPSVPLEFDIRPLPGDGPGCAPVRGRSTERLQIIAAERQWISASSRCFGCRRWTPRPRPRIVAACEQSPVYSAGRRGFLPTEGRT